MSAYDRDYYLQRLGWRADQQFVVDHIGSARRVLSVGAGAGELEARLLERGCEITALEPSPAAETLFRERVPGQRFIRAGLDGAPWEEDFDAVVFCESFEHIAEEEFERNWPSLVNLLRRSHGLLIIANESHVPVLTWEHLRKVDDAVLLRLTYVAQEIIVKDGGCMVLRF